MVHGTARLGPVAHVGDGDDRTTAALDHQAGGFLRLPGAHVHHGYRRSLACEQQAAGPADGPAGAGHQGPAARQAPGHPPTATP